MKIVIAIDSFKGSLSSLEAGESAKKGILAVFPDADIKIYSVADGGEGTVESIGMLDESIHRKVKVCDPLRRLITAEYCILGNTAVIEISAAAGLTLLNENERNPLVTTTYGVGEIILDAVNYGCRRFIIGLGGSATNDCGIGMLKALGYKITDSNGVDVPDGAYGVQHAVLIDDSCVSSAIGECEFCIACDVTNPLCGDNGASKVFSPQKGASIEAAETMDEWMHSFAQVVTNKYPHADPKMPGVGAAGGTGFAFSIFKNTRFVKGYRLIAELTGLWNELSDCDIFVTGEGRLDKQSVMGKVPCGLANEAKRNGALTVAFAGCVGNGAEECNREGIDAFFPILRTPVALEQAMDNELAAPNLTATVEQAFRLIRSVKG